MRNSRAYFQWRGKCPFCKSNEVIVAYYGLNHDILTLECLNKDCEFIYHDMPFKEFDEIVENKVSLNEKCSYMI